MKNKKLHEIYFKTQVERMMQRFGHQLYINRKMRNVSINKLSKESKVSVKEIKNIERGHLFKSTIVSLTKLANYFDFALEVKFKQANVNEIIEKHYVKSFHEETLKL
jgi:transcriptional regulator with XRE-family HTH domain